MPRFVVVLAALALSACGVEPTDVEETPAEATPAEPAVVAKWTAPASTRDPKACDSAMGPVKVETSSLTALELPADAHPGMTDITKAAETAPDEYKVRFETTEGDMVVEVKREWSPIGADRFYNLVNIGYFDDVRFFRNIAGFMVQFGVNGYPAANAVWSESRIQDEPVVLGNDRGVITFAKCGAPNCRSTQLFINHKSNNGLDRQGFSGFGRVVEGMDVVDKLYDCYGEGAPRGQGPRQDLAQSMGNAYLDAGWPEFSSVKKASVVE